MKKLLLLLMVLVANIGCIARQTNEPALKKAKDYINYKITYWVLVERKKANAVKEKDLDSIKSEIGNITIDNVTDFQTLSKTLGVKFKTAFDNITNPINNIEVRQYASYPPADAADQLTQRCFEELKTHYPGIYDAIVIHQEALTKTVAQYLVEKTPPPPGEQETTETIPKEIVNAQNDPPPPQSFNMLYLVLNFVSILAVIALFLYLRKEKSKMEQRLQPFDEFLQSEKETVSRRRKDEFLSSLNNNNKAPLNGEDIEKTIEGSNCFQTLTAEVKVLKKLLDQNNKGNRSMYDNSEHLMGKTDPMDIFYMSGPVNNYFPNSAKSLKKEGTVYKFTVSKNKQEASFETHTAGAPVSEIVKRIESYIKPACDEDNLPDLNTKNIITKKRGTAILEGDKWVIKTKAVIHYE
ncbi:hypothetical protein FAM09_13135 [Niastella caeni]|uniref:Lipoprotein n=1 Tax=Niastella caeni TaxID=2569763 RepID=A0A4S8HV11_9BACT|nr:hypothetical protein [Niastella caeni]THU39443.1 hypothetical protein FAM09_13135 [Niastella caeni]